jgi:hypothetical protein
MGLDLLLPSIWAAWLIMIVVLKLFWRRIGPVPQQGITLPLLNASGCLISVIAVFAIFLLYMLLIAADSLSGYRLSNFGWTLIDPTTWRGTIVICLIQIMLASLGFRYIVLRGSKADSGLAWRLALLVATWLLLFQTALLWAWHSGNPTLEKLWRKQRVEARDREAAREERRREREGDEPEPAER